ncbi:MAG: DUF86 domain-containing protein [Bacteroidia bacterium]
MQNSPTEFLRHILDECYFLKKECDNIKTFDNFLNDEVAKRPYVRSLEIIGEASKKISADWKLKWKNVPWKEMSGMRDKLIHDYMGVNYKIVWDVAITKVPQLVEEIEKIITT